MRCSTFTTVELQKTQCYNHALLNYAIGKPCPRITFDVISNLEQAEINCK